MLARSFRPMDWYDFKREIKKLGWCIMPYSKSTHFKIETQAGEKIMDFAVHHKEGGKKYVKPFYVSQFLKEVEIRKLPDDE
jgi:2-hydroxychromene-2-carboxylate isomerase